MRIPFQLLISRTDSPDTLITPKRRLLLLLVRVPPLTKRFFEAGSYLVNLGRSELRIEA